MIIDLHCDTISVLSDKGGGLNENRLQFDLRRAREAGVKGQILAMYSRFTRQQEALEDIMRQAGCFMRQAEQNAGRAYVLQKWSDWQPDGDRIALLLHLEGADCIPRSMEILEQLYQMGLRSLGLTWNYDNIFAAGCKGAGTARGLSRAGRELVKRIEHLPMLLDLSHLGETAFYEVLDLFPRPVMVSHSNTAALCPHPRNLKDKQLEILRENGGVIGFNQVKFFIDPSRPTLSRLVDHLVYAAEQIGAEHLALGSDFDGAADNDLALSGVEEYPALLAEMKRRGFTAREIALITGGNALRLLERNLA
ncbi:MAG: membrane dipeptidase [Syntrophomonadaceae bacterium]|nr:membrane dipeptidase [Syntrophomonadaceae bacterium]